MEAKQIQHLYNRIGFGITAVELDKIQHKSKEQIVTNLFKQSQEYTPIKMDTSFITEVRRQDLRNKKKRQELQRKSRQKIKELNKIWLEKLFTSNEILREKMTLFWANHFVCEDKNLLHVIQYNNTLRKYALGNFKDFVKAISKEAAMLKYLNNKQNKKQSPNENFARELMELFTLGQGNYTELDIKESARAFTGYNHNFLGKFLLKRKHHDYNQKTFLGKTGNFNGDDIIDIILQEKQCATFICKKIYKYFVNDTLNKEHINKMVSVFYADYDIEKLMKFVLVSDWFYKEENIGVKIKSPVELLAGINNVVPFQFQKKKQSLLLQKILGQVLLLPPNVAGWKGGKTWIDSNTIVIRIRLASVLLNNDEITYSDKGGLEDNITDFSEKRLRKRTGIKVIANWSSFEKNYPTTSNTELIEQLIVSPLNKGTKQLLENTNNVSKRDFCVQLLSLPEYQLC